MVYIWYRQDHTQVREVEQIVQGEQAIVVGWVEVRAQEGMSIYYLPTMWEEVPHD